jgi:hypothetical protein
MMTIAKVLHNKDSVVQASGSAAPARLRDYLFVAQTFESGSLADRKRVLDVIH